MANSNNFAFAPAHPGEFLREDILPYLKMSKRAFANYLGVSRTTLYAVLNEKQAVETRLACKLGQALGNGPRFWLTMQMQYDLWIEDQKSHERIPPLPLVNAA